MPRLASRASGWWSRAWCGTPPGSPAEGIIVYAYQTDASGVYPELADPPGPWAARHGRLRAWSRTDAQGRYRFETVRPGNYPGRDAPQHIHTHIIEPGCCTYWIDDVVFTDDRYLTPLMRGEVVHGRGGRGVATPVRDGDGVWQVRRDIRLGEGVPGHPTARRPPAAPAQLQEGAMIEQVELNVAETEISSLC